MVSMRNKVTMADVASRAGVSLQTVSRVVQNKANVSKATRERVQAVVRELNYEPDINAQILASGRSRSIGVITVGDIYFGMQKLFTAVEARARRAGRYVVSASVPENDPSELVSAMKYMRARGVLASVVLAQNPAIIPVLENTPVNRGVLVMSGKHRLSDYVTIGFDQVSGSRELTAHLLSSTDSILHIAGPLSAQDAMERLAAYQEVCAEAGAAARWVSANGWSAEAGYNLGRDLNPVPQAIFAASDRIAIGLMRALSERRLEAGKDYLLGGFDDIAEAAYLRPALTTVRQDFSLLAQEVIANLEEIIAGKEPCAVQVQTALIVRESAPQHAVLAAG
ncbi:LacI family DNA-binding transcriptional regulator [Arcanobacterium hippocoleae]